MDRSELIQNYLAGEFYQPFEVGADFRKDKILGAVTLFLESICLKKFCVFHLLKILRLNILSLESIMFLRIILKTSNCFFQIREVKIYLQSTVPIR